MTNSSEKRFKWMPLVTKTWLLYGWTKHLGLDNCPMKVLSNLEPTSLPWGELALPNNPKAESQKALDRLSLLPGHPRARYLGSST